MNGTSHFLRRLTVAGASVVLGLALVLTAAAPVAAATAVESGWWTSVPVPAPDAHDGLLVQGGLSGPSAYAAVGYQLEVDEDLTSLVLTVADGSATTPGSALRACPLTQGFESGPGQPMNDAPAYDCALEVTAEASDDGTRYAFDITSLLGAEALGLAVLPSAPTDRVVLETPGSDAVGSTGGPSDGSAPGSSDTLGGAPPATPTSPPSDRGSSSGDVALPPASSPAPAVAPPEADPDAEDPPADTGPTEQAATNRSGPALQAPPAIATTSDDGPMPVIGVLLLAGLAATFWRRAGRGEPTPLADPA